MKKIFIFLITLYQKTISPVFALVFNSQCRYDVSCSEYSIQSLQKYGAWHGGLLSLKRIGSCNPWNTN